MKTSLWKKRGTIARYMVNDFSLGYVLIRAPEKGHRPPIHPSTGVAVGAGLVQYIFQVRPLHLSLIVAPLQSCNARGAASGYP